MFSNINKNLRYIAILAIIPLFTMGLTTDYFTDAEAIKSKCTATSQYGSSTYVCGFQPGISAGTCDANYSPMWRIFMT